MSSAHHPGYELVKKDYVDEIDSQATLYTHSSGARVLFLINNDDNKVFNISFKTPPEDDTGVAHIMEHSVLCGSRKYPVKEPFVELMKSSLNTFLNAMTYPDKTIYPVASRNHADFRNLVDVYMDAVFEPELSREAFEQEGWHYEVEDDQLNFKGVVFNEMKGVFSSPESFLDLQTNRVLFPDSSYRYESGGYPPSIPDLSYEQYCRFHEEKYHPANSWIILYGDLDEQYWLDYINDGYLCKYRLPGFPLPELIAQPPVSEPVDVACSYPASEGDNEEESSLLTLSFAVGDSTDLEKNFAMGVLDAILIGSSASPLKKALLESGLGRDTLDYGYCNETLQTTWTIGLRDTSPQHKEAFVDLVFSTLKHLADEGLPEKIVQASMNSCEFQLREANFGSYPKGLVYAMNIMTRWLYGADPLDGLKYEPLLKNLKEKIAAGGYFENLIREAFLENKHYAVVTCKPDAAMGETLDSEEQNRLSQYKEQLQSSEIEALERRNEVLLQRQVTPDSPEALATIPHVSIGDLPTEVERIPLEEKVVSGQTLLYQDLKSQGICYIQFSFDCSAVKEEEYPWLALLNSLLMKCGTKDSSYDDFTQTIACHTGGISSTLNVFSTYLNESGCQTHLTIQAKAMKEKSPELLGLIENIFYDVDFNDLKRIKELLGSICSKLRNSLQNNGDRVARNYIGSSLSATGYVTSLVSGIGYSQFLNRVTEQLQTDSQAVINKLLELKARVLCRNNLLINVSAEKNVFEAVEPALSDLVAKMPIVESESYEINKTADCEVTGISAPGSVQYVVKGINIRNHGYQGGGCIDLLTQLLSTGFLWEKVRVQGGAYGCYMSFDKISGALMLSSYRDPNLAETLKVYDEIANFLENLELSQAGLDKLIIGTVGRLDGPLTTSQKGRVALNRYLAGVNYEMLDKNRGDLLKTTVEDLRAFAVYFRKMVDEGKICVHGAENRLKEAGDLFQKIISVSE